LPSFWPVPSLRSAPAAPAPPPRKAPANSAITTKVKAAFVKDEMVKASEITVETYKGIVQLSGFVNTSEQKTRAAQIASGVPDVKSVKNDIQIK
jgi:hyperosmotically inducible protein